MRNCWSFAVPELARRDGWLLVRFTRRSKSVPSCLFGWLGIVLVVAGIAAINLGAWIKTGRWLHVYHARSVKGPYRSYEPDNGGPSIKRPPLSFSGQVVERNELF